MLRNNNLWNILPGIHIENMNKAEQYTELRQEMYDMFKKVNEKRGCYASHKMPDLDYELSIEIDMQDIKFQNGKIYKAGVQMVNLYWEISAGCGEYDNESFSFPASYLDGDWEKQEDEFIAWKKKMREEELVAKRKKAEKMKKEVEKKEKEKAKQKIIDEKALLKRLQTKYNK